MVKFVSRAIVTCVLLAIGIFAVYWGWNYVSGIVKAEAAKPKIALEISVSEAYGSNADRVEEVKKCFQTKLGSGGITIKSGAPMVARVNIHKIGSHREEFRDMQKMHRRINDPPDVVVDIPHLQADLTITDSGGREIWKRTSTYSGRGSFVENISGDVQEHFGKRAWEGILSNLDGMLPPSQYLISPPTTLPANALGNLPAPAGNRNPPGTPPSSEPPPVEGTRRFLTPSNSN